MRKKKKEIKNRTEHLVSELGNKEKYFMEEKEIKEFDYYYKKAENNDNPILLVAVIAFHHKKGSIVEYIHPTREEILKQHAEFFEDLQVSKLDYSEKILEDILNQLTFFCLPDAVHTTNEDAQFFFIQNYKHLLYGISCYRQVKTQSTEVDIENTRDCVQKAICIVSKMPLFGQFYSKLCATISAFFNQNTLKDKQILEQLFANYESISFKNININEIFMSFSLRKLFMFSKEKIFTILKMILLEKKIIVYSHISNNVCSFILSLVSLIPGNTLFNLNIGNSVKNFHKCINMFGLPFKLFNKESKLYPLFTLFDFSDIENTKSFLIGTTNQLVLNHGKMKYDLTVNIDTGKIIMNSEIPDKILKTTKEEKYIYNTIYNKIKDNFNDKEEDWMVNNNLYDPNFEGSDDYIRNEFKNYFYDFLINFSLSMQIINNSNEENSLQLSILSENIEKEVLTDEDIEDTETQSKTNLSKILFLI